MHHTDIVQLAHADVKDGITLSDNPHHLEAWVLSPSLACVCQRPPRRWERDLEWEARRAAPASSLTCERTVSRLNLEAP